MTEEKTDVGKLRRAAAAAAMLILVSSVPVQAVTVNFGTAAAVATDSIQNWPKAPATVSETAVLIDADTGAVLYDKGKDEYRYPASTTKLMTLLVAVENASPKEQVTFTETGVARRELGQQQYRHEAGRDHHHEGLLVCGDH